MSRDCSVRQRCNLSTKKILHNEPLCVPSTLDSLVKTVKKRLSLRRTSEFTRPLHHQKAHNPSLISEPTGQAQRNVHDISQPSQKKNIDSDIKHVIREKLNLGHNTSSSSSLYKSRIREYDNDPYIDEPRIAEPSSPSIPLRKDDDFETYKLKKDADPLERIKGRGLPMPWENEFLNYMKGMINDSVRRLDTLVKTGYHSALYQIHSAYNGLYHRMHKKKR